jgi:hypothetical protein
MSWLSFSHTSSTFPLVDGHDFDMDSELNYSCFMSESALGPVAVLSDSSLLDSSNASSLMEDNNSDVLLAPATFIQGKPSKHRSLEGCILDRNASTIETYLKTLDSPSGIGNRGKKSTRSFALRQQWFNRKTRWARIATLPDSVLPRGRASSSGDADVFYLTSDEFLNASRANHVFHEPVVIKEKFLDSGMHTVQAFMHLLRDMSGHSLMGVKHLDDSQHSSMPVDKFLKNMYENRAQQGVNALNLRNITKSHRPVFTMLPRFRLLETLVERVQAVNLGKLTESVPADVSSYTSFNILGLTGAFSGAHVDSLGGTWVRNLAGVKFWMIVPKSEVEWDEFVQSSSSWTPRGKERLILLEQDDVLFMPPGVRVLHPYPRDFRATCRVHYFHRAQTGGRVNDSIQGGD